MEFKNLVQLTQYFDSEEKCNEYLRFTRWSDGEAVCQFCGYKKCYVFKGQRTLKCANTKCKRRFSITKGTIFESSKIPLRSWFIAIYLLTSHKKGVSSHQMARDLGLCQKSAWHLEHRIRQMMRAKIYDFVKADVEIDETFFGPTEKNLHKDKKAALKQGTGHINKTPVIGMFNRETKEVMLQVLPEVIGETVKPFIYDRLAEGSRVITDGHGSYAGLHHDYESHDIIYHSRNEYVRGDVHTNSIENFWSHFKRGIYGVYHHCSPKHLHRYCDSFGSRWNTRKMGEVERFDFILGNAQYTRLKLADLVRA